ncbi:MAG: TatD family hydrolase, partial [Burkholderiaceae bacterium]
LARRHGHGFSSLGLHRICVQKATDGDLDLLRERVAAAKDDPRFVAIGEIGVDFFLPGFRDDPLRAKQERFYSEQLKLARDAGLPVLLHVRRAQDIVLKYLRRVDVPGGIAHAFNGSFQQAETFAAMGFKLGFGGAMTFTRALQIRRLATGMPLDAIVLETDAPDIPPAWRHPDINTPEEIPRLGAALAELRGIDAGTVAETTSRNALAALPRLAPALRQPAPAAARPQQSPSR